MTSGRDVDSACRRDVDDRAELEGLRLVALDLQRPLEDAEDGVEVAGSEPEVVVALAGDGGVGLLPARVTGLDHGDSVVHAYDVPVGLAGRVAEQPEAHREGHAASLPLVHELGEPPED